MQGMLAIIVALWAKVRIGRLGVEERCCGRCTLSNYDVIRMMGDRHGHLGQCHMSDLVLCKLSMMSTRCELGCSLIVSTIDYHVAW